MWTFSNPMIWKDHKILDSHESIFPLNPSPKEIPLRQVCWLCLSEVCQRGSSESLEGYSWTKSDLKFDFRQIGTIFLYPLGLEMDHEKRQKKGKIQF